MMKNVLGFGCWMLVLAAVPTGASAADTIKIAKIVPYKDAEAVKATNLPKCDWNQKLSQQIAGKSRGQVEVVDGDLSSVQGKTLDLVIVNAHTAGGGSPTGPKWGRVNGELREDGKLLGNFSIKRATARPFTISVCGPLDKVADALSDDIVNWLKNPTIDPNAGKALEADETVADQPASQG